MSGCYCMMMEHFHKGVHSPLGTKRSSLYVGVVSDTRLQQGYSECRVLQSWAGFKAVREASGTGKALIEVPSSGDKGTPFL